MTMPISLCWKLLLACDSGNLPEVESILSKRPNLAGYRYQYPSPEIDEELKQLQVEAAEEVGGAEDGATAPTTSSNGRTGNLQQVGLRDIDPAVFSSKLSQSFNQGGEPLMYAARSGHLLVVEALVERYGAQVNAEDQEDWSALHYACFNGHARIASYLLSRGAQYHKKTVYEKATPLDFAVHRRFHDVIDCFPAEARPPKPPAPLTPQERTHVLAKALDKLRKSNQQGSGCFFLFRYYLSKADQKALEAFLKDPSLVSGEASLTIPVVDLLGGRQAKSAKMILFTSSEARNAAAQSIRSLDLKGTASGPEGKGNPKLLRAGSVSGLQHFVVVSETSV